MVLPRSRPKLVVTALLTLALALTAVLAYQAQSAARSHSAVAFSTLRDYAAFAAWEYARSARENLAEAEYTTFRALWPTNDRNPPHLSVRDFARTAPNAERECRCPAGAPACWCAGLNRHRYYYRLHVATHELTTEPAPVPSPLLAWVSRSLDRSIADTGLAGWAVGLVIGRPSSTVPETAPEAIAYYVLRDSAGKPATDAYAFDADTAGIRAMLQIALRQRPLLPPSLVGPVANDSVLLATVTDATGRLLFHTTEPPPAALVARDTVGATFAGLTVGLAIRPEWAGQLLIGGLPRSRLPLILGLFAVAAGLVVVAIWQTRREQELSRMRTDFTTSVSHELRTPLAQILLFAETLRLGRIPHEPGRREAADVIIRETRRLMHLVENVLHFTAPRRQRRLAQSPGALIALAPVVRDVLASFAPLASEAGSHLATLLDDSAVAAIEPNALRQILLNLLDNAIKYGPAGQTVRVTVARSEGMPHRVRLTVDDSGPGIAPGDRQAVWQPFARLASARDSDVRGSGVGLAVVRELAVQAGGAASIDDAPDGGARVVIDLPGTRVA